MAEFLILAALGVAMIILGFIAKRLPALGLVIAIGMLSAPLVAWQMYNPDNFRSDGSAAGLVLWILYWGAAFFLLGAGCFVLKVSLASMRGEDIDVVDHVVSRMTGGTPAPTADPEPKVRSAGNTGHRREEDLAWLTDAARVQGMIALARERQGNGERIALAAQDQDAFRALRAARGDLDVEILEPHQVNQAKLAECGKDAATLVLMLATSARAAPTEDQLLFYCKALTFELRLQVHHGLDDLIRAGLMDTKVRDRLVAIGAKPDEPLSHRWVTQAIAAARRKAARGN